MFVQHPVKRSHRAWLMLLNASTLRIASQYGVRHVSLRTDLLMEIKIYLLLKSFRLLFFHLIRDSFSLIAILNIHLFTEWNQHILSSGVIRERRISSSDWPHLLMCEYASLSVFQAHVISNAKVSCVIFLALGIHAACACQRLNQYQCTPQHSQSMPLTCCSSPCFTCVCAGLSCVCQSQALIICLYSLTHALKINIYLC